MTGPDAKLYVLPTRRRTHLHDAQVLLAQAEQDGWRRRRDLEAAQVHALIAIALELREIANRMEST